jgi:hypothetical protein
LSDRLILERGLRFRRLAVADHALREQVHDAARATFGVDARPGPDPARLERLGVDGVPVVPHHRWPALAERERKAGVEMVVRRDAVRDHLRTGQKDVACDFTDHGGALVIGPEARQANAACNRFTESFPFGRRRGAQWRPTSAGDFSRYIAFLIVIAPRIWPTV